VNNAGLRGQNINIEKKANHFRILMLGDSFTMGKGVEDNQTFSALLQDFLNTENNVCDAKTIEVLNAGVDSYSPILSFIQLKRDLAPLDPDMVVLNLDVSDLIQETAYREEAIYGQDGEIQAVPGTKRNVSLNERIRGWVENNLYMTRLLLFYTNKILGYRDLTIRGVVNQANFEVAEHTLASDRKNRQAEWKMIFDSILKIKNFCDDREMIFLLTIYPWGHQVSDTEWIPGR
jgi:acid stress-induced BolA-like protein IbaG/YrbA